MTRLEKLKSLRIIIIQNDGKRSKNIKIDSKYCRNYSKSDKFIKWLGR
tara:strand:+ start:340 stop:483 length:144 start_codon:yes stop_codon:yes gene_type:complete